MNIVVIVLFIAVLILYTFTSEAIRRLLPKEHKVIALLIAVVIGISMLIGWLIWLPGPTF